jgi:hypothetical protein
VRLIDCVALRMGEWENGRVGDWENGIMEWENERMEE